MRKTILIASVAALLAIVGAASYVSAHGGDVNAIHACVLNGQGQVRLVDPNEDCRANETAMDWAKAGPQGPVGPAGPQGPAAPGPGAFVVGDVTIESMPGGDGNLTTIPIRAFQWHIEDPSGNPGGGSRLDPSFRFVTITKELDAATPQLVGWLDDCAAITQPCRPRDVTIHLYRAGSQTVRMTYALRDVVPHAITQDVTGARVEPPLETVIFEFRTMDVVFSSGNHTTVP
jgi:type VI protein secretion system component Hcp